MESLDEIKEEDISKYERMMTFETEWRDYAQEYDDLTSWEGIPDTQILGELRKLGQKQDNRFEETRFPPYFMGIIGNLRLNGFDYQVGRNMCHFEGNPYDGDDTAFATITLYDKDGEVIILSDEEKTMFHKSNLTELERALKKQNGNE
jgi:hypothetical protein